MANKFEALFSSDSGEWETPPEIFGPLNEEFKFTLDVCASDANHKCERYFTIEDNCFEQSWVDGGTFYMNPVYGQPEMPCPKEGCKKKRCIERGYHVYEYQPGIIDFIRKAVQETLKGAKGVALVPVRTDTEWWSLVWSHKTHRPRKWVKQIRFIRGRVKFVGAPTSAPFPSCIVVFGK